MGLGGFALTLVAFGLVFYFLILRPQKKRDQEATDMRNSLAVGDEVTTIGGIIGKVISIKEETFVLETTKDKTKIRFLKGAVRSIDVKIADVVAQTAEKTETEAPEQK
ncbi:MAG: preprotein translocase subunit YajC [Clostridia bacterium]|nr:preprotein translocase subunit YajC [Clostridia bacterium]